ncbi:hypothetical protein JHK85_040096 [Glycine max]|nr:hypothetical protein JHK85_040096 [Glycine max]
MESKAICFCIRVRKSKSKESKVKDLEKLSHVKPNHKGKTKGCTSTTPVGDGGGINVHGANTVANNDVGVAAAEMTAAHTSLMSANGVQDGSGHGHGELDPITTKLMADIVLETIPSFRDDFN